jgi:hypothetical protein
MDGMKFTIDGSIKGSKHIASMEYYMDLLSERGSTNGATVRRWIQPGLSSPRSPPTSLAATESAIPPPPISLPAASQRSTSTYITSGRYLLNDPTPPPSLPAARVRDPTSTYLTLLLLSLRSHLHLTSPPAIVPIVAVPTMVFCQQRQQQ